MGNYLKRYLPYLLGFVGLSCPAIASAYIGPGLGTGAVVAVLGTFFGLLMLIVGVIWYPIKKLIRHFWPKR